MQHTDDENGSSKTYSWRQYKEALEEGNMAVVRECLQSSLGPECIFDNDYFDKGSRRPWRPLHVVAHAASSQWHNKERLSVYIQEALLLLDHGANPNAQDCMGQTPLHTACNCDSLRPLVELLFQHGADPMLKDWQGRTPAERYVAGFALLGRPITAPEHLSFVLLLQTGRVSSSTSVDKQMKISETLIESAKSGAIEQVRKELDDGANIDSKSGYGCTALMWAAYNGHVDVAKLLVERGADVAARMNDGGTALIVASENGRCEIVSLLIHTGADINAKNNNGSTALSFAAEKGYADIVKLLVDARADINMEGWMGQTALTLAARQGHSEVVKMLTEPRVRGRDMSGEKGWEKYAQYVSIPEGVSDAERRGNMRFQFLFAGPSDADAILSSLPSDLRGALGRPHMAMFAPPAAGADVAGKYQVWFEGVNMTIGEGKDLMNRVVRAGGGIYEAFLT